MNQEILKKEPAKRCYSWLALSNFNDVLASISARDGNYSAGMVKRRCSVTLAQAGRWLTR